MLRSLKELGGYTVAATDGEIGKVVDFLLDDVSWAIRALVVRTSFLERRKVLISPISFRRPDWDLRHFNVALTIDKVQRSPGIDLDKPVSRQHERDYYGYYGYPAYWGYVGTGITPGPLPQTSTSPPLAGNSDGSPADVHLRSASELRGYHIEGSDKAIGHVEDFVVDDEAWTVRYLVVDTSNWWLGKKVLVAPSWAEQVSWADREIHLGLSRKLIKGSPEWNAYAPVNREYEERLFDYYGRPVYWANGSLMDAPPTLKTPTGPMESRET